jgi:hypothetical protein
MKTILRALILLLIALWLGAVLFFPVVAATAFSSVSDTHIAGTIVGKCLRLLHYEGLAAGSLIVLLLLIAQATKAVPRNVAPLVLATLVMLGLTAYSQFFIIPRMEQDRIAAGGAIDAAPPSNPNRADFNKLHLLSERVEAGVLAAGVIFIILAALPGPKPPLDPDLE